VNGFTASGRDAGYSSGITSRGRHMGVNFESTMTEADFKRPLLDAAEDRLAREAIGGVDLSVEGLTDSLLSRLLRLFSGGGAGAARS
jgi:hypothetical protein